MGLDLSNIRLQCTVGKDTLETKYSTVLYTVQCSPVVYEKLYFFDQLLLS